MIAMPPKIHDWLAERIERSWPEPAPVVARIPAELEPGKVTRLAGGGPFGLMFDGRLDELDGRVALEVLENSRMAGEVYFRLWDDGTLEPLEPAPRIGYAYRTEEERAQAEREYFAHNRTAYDLLRERGFLGGAGEQR
jgi:hypothetical protein